MELVITCFKALYGDSFLIEEPTCGTRFLVDCGFKLTYNSQIKKRIDSADFIILTHSDEDHINGVFPLLNDYPEKFSLNKIYVNSPESIELTEKSGKISVRQAKSLIELLKNKKTPFFGLVQGQTINVSKSITLEIISPTQTELDLYYEEYNSITPLVLVKPVNTPISLNLIAKSAVDLSNLPDSYPKKEDDVANASSIAFILHFNGKKILFLGDAHPEVISNYLSKAKYSSTNKAMFDYIKLSHHGSAKSISKELLNLISCNNFIISTNGGKAKSKHPSAETIAKLSILVDRNGNKNINFYFNYSVAAIESRNGLLLTTEEQKLHNIKYIETNEIRLR